MSDLLNSASLVMIPSGYAEDKVYSVVPSDGSGDMAFTRASNGTRVNSAGLVEVCPWNFNTNSQDFTSSWGTDGTSTATNNFATAPNGTTTAAKVVANSTNGYAYKSLAVAPNTYTLSYYVKASANTTMSIAINDVGGSGYSAKYNIPVTTEWQRIEHTATITSGGNLYVDYGSLQTGKDYYIWGAQLNIGSTAKPYSPTTDRLNVPRLTYQNGGGGCPSLLLEKQSTNLLTYSEQFDNAAWTKDGSSIGANNVISPDGTQNAEKLIDTTSTGIHQIYSGVITTVSSTTYTYSIYLKKGEKNWAKIQMANNGGANFNLLNGTIGVIDSGITAKIENAVNDWYKCIITFTTSATADRVYVRLANGDNVISYTGNGTDGLYIWGAQLEASSYPTSYIPTTSSSATRVADACSKTSATALIGQTEGTMFGEIQVISGVATMLGWMRKLSGGVYGDIILAYVDNNGIASAGVDVGGVNQVAIAGTSALSTGYHKIAFAYKANDFVLYVNGSQVASDTSGSVPTCDEIYIDKYIDGGDRNATKKQFVLFKTRLTNAELATLTTI